jgi:hypothetical protein
MAKKNNIFAPFYFPKMIVPKMATQALFCVCVAKWQNLAPQKAH